MLNVVTENFMEMILDVVKQNIENAPKKFQDTKNKEYEKTRKEINEFIGALNKHQSETENTINREINKLMMKLDIIKEEVTCDMENLRKKNGTETQNTVEDHSSRLEEVEDRISELEDKIEIKGRTEEMLDNTRPMKGICKNSTRVSGLAKYQI
jgi:membrane-associated HD superfamily phosphohydrolase